MVNKMQGTGIFITEEERGQVETEYKCSGMMLSGGQPMGDPAYRVYLLTEKYKPPVGSGLNLKTGEFMMP
jgi:hypothetical protein